MHQLQPCRWRERSSIRVVLSLVDEVRTMGARSGTRRTCRVRPLSILFTPNPSPCSSHLIHYLMGRHIGLHRVRDTLHNQLSELLKSKPRNKADDSLLSEITRLESELVVVRDDLVSYSADLFSSAC